MRRLRNFLRLRPADRLLLAKALLLVWGIRLGMWLLPFRVLRGLQARLAQGPGGAEQVCHLTPETVAWAVAAVSRYVPAATCLTQALAAQVLLARRGRAVELRIGVAKGDSGRLEAHAWLESQGAVIFGDQAGLSRFTQLPHLEAVGS
jgi:hypothetical protein